MLSQFPTELLLQIAGYLRVTQRIGKESGFNTCNACGLTSRDLGFTIALCECAMYHRNLQPLVNLALTCKRLAPVAQEVLFRDVSLPQAHPARQGRVTSVSFLRTLVQRPDLAYLVERLAVWFLKDNPIDLPKQAFSVYACRKCSPSLRAIVERMHRFPSSAGTGWMCDLKHPKEAWICALIIASLPKIKTLELYAANNRAPKTQVVQASRGKRCFEEPAITGSSSDHALEISRLARALAVTEVENLTLSTGLNGLHVAGLPSLKTLTVDYSKYDPFSRVSHGHFANVTTLNIQADETDRLDHDFPERLNLLISSLLSVRTLEFTCIAAARCCSFMPNVDRIIIRPVSNTFAFLPVDKLKAYRRAIEMALLLLIEYPNGWKLQYFEFHWPSASSILIRVIMDFSDYVVSKTGVKVRVWNKGKIFRTYG